jgi:phosphate-selective porin
MRLPQWLALQLLLGLSLTCSVTVQSQEPPPEQAAQQEEQQDGPGEETRVAALLDDDSTNEMHDDTTILRNVEVLDDRGLELFGALRIWLGGAVQYDYYNIEGIFRSTSNGDELEEVGFRRLDGILRAQLFDWGEVKVQYDFDRGIFRDLYLRWVSDRPETPITITIGEQKEPMSLEHLTGNKFEMAQERSAPGDAFGRWRSSGLRLHKAFSLDPEKRRFDYFEEDTAFVTTSVGVFTQDIEERHDTDVAVTGRITAGRDSEGVGVHIGLSSSYREGDYNRISFRPEVNEADRIVLARPDANTQGIFAAEAAYNHGRLHVQGEAFYSEYRGRENAYGAGGYVQAGWFLTTDARRYNPRWGIQAPLRPSGRYAAELLARLSVTRADTSGTDWNNYMALTLGANVTYRNLKASLNTIYGTSRDPIGGEDEGLALVLRAQYIF